MLLGTTNQDLHGLIKPAISFHPLPSVPTDVPNGLRMPVLELETNKELRRIMSCRISSHEEPLLGIDPHQQGGIELKRIAPQLVRLTRFLAAVLDLKAALIRRTILGRCPRSQKCISDDSHALTRRSLERDHKGRPARIGAKENPTTHRLETFHHELDERLPRGWRHAVSGQP